MVITLKEFLKKCENLLFHEDALESRFIVLSGVMM